MNRYFFEISYFGTCYSGWQKQKTAPTLQQTIEDAFIKLRDQRIQIHGCGRTDKGVHASQYFFQVNLASSEKLDVSVFNEVLPDDIIVRNIYEVEAFRNAQKHAIARTYDYWVSLDQNPEYLPYSYTERRSLNHERLVEAIQAIEGRHDFRNFCKKPNLLDNSICLIMQTSMKYDKQNQLLRFQFKGNRFLHHMIRLLMGNVLKIGRGTLSISEFQDYIDLKKKPKYFDLIAPEGLYLTHIEYPFLATSYQLPHFLPANLLKNRFSNSQKNLN